MEREEWEQVESLWEQADESQEHIEESQEQIERARELQEKARKHLDEDQQNPPSEAEIRNRTYPYRPSHPCGDGLVEWVMNDLDRQKAHQEMVSCIDAKLRRVGLESVIPEERRSVIPWNGSS